MPEADARDVLPDALQSVFNDGVDNEQKEDGGFEEEVLSNDIGEDIGRRHSLFEFAEEAVSDIKTHVAKRKAVSTPVNTIERRKRTHIITAPVASGMPNHLKILRPFDWTVYSQMATTSMPTRHRHAIASAATATGTLKWLPPSRMSEPQFVGALLPLLPPLELPMSPLSSLLCEPPLLPPPPLGAIVGLQRTVGDKLAQDRKTSTGQTARRNERGDREVERHAGGTERRIFVAARPTAHPSAGNRARTSTEEENTGYGVRNTGYGIRATGYGRSSPAWGHSQQSAWGARCHGGSRKPPSRAP